MLFCPTVSTVWFVGAPLISPGRVLPSQWLRFDKLHVEVPILSPSHSTHSSWSLIMLIYVHLISHSTKAGNKKCVWWIAPLHCSSSSKPRTYLSFICSILCLSGIFSIHCPWFKPLFLSLNVSALTALLIIHLNTERLILFLTLLPLRQWLQRFMAHYKQNWEDKTSGKKWENNLVSSFVKRSLQKK